MVASYVFPHDATSPATEATLILSSSPSSVAAIEKTKQLQQVSGNFRLYFNSSFGSSYKNGYLKHTFNVSLLFKQAKRHTH
uniref:Uncharacterized protein n=1 Tax=Onchocerca volvulus TaxID=6282 RepID=A0A8R1TMI2_ONCVO